MLLLLILITILMKKIDLLKLCSKLTLRCGKFTFSLCYAIFLSKMHIYTKI